VAGVLGYPAVLFVVLATQEVIAAYAMEGLQSVALVIAVYGLAELLEHLRPDLARVAFIAGLLGAATTFLTIALIPIVPADPPPFGIVTFIAVGSIVGRALVALWVMAVGFAISRGNGRTTGVLGEVVAIGTLIELLAISTNLLATNSAFGGWNLLVEIGQALFLILVWRFVRAALTESPQLA
jgi:hypothetical protein